MMPLNEHEERFLGHISRWGSDGYPIVKLHSGGWVWESGFCGITGPPIVYKTKKAAVAYVEAYIAILLDKKAGRL
jgi:hypothetical protein